MRDIRRYQTPIRWLITRLAVAIGCAMAPTVALATPITGVGINVIGGASPSKSACRGTPLFGCNPVPGRVDVDLDYVSPIDSFFFGAGYALPGALGIGLSESGRGLNGEGIAQYEIFDTVVTGPSPTALTQLFLNVNGSISAPADSGASVLFFVRINPGTPEEVRFNGCVQTPHTGAPCGGIPTQLDLSNTDHARISTPFFTVSTGVPFVIQVTEDAIAGVGSEVNWFDTAGFPTSGPVFNLPPGFTVNSVDGDIVNNQWLGATPTSPVPEPATLTLTALGLAGVARRSRRRRAAR